MNVLGLASNDVRKRGANWTNLSHWVIPGDFRLGADTPMISFSGRGVCNVHLFCNNFSGQIMIFDCIVQRAYHRKHPCMKT